MSFIENNPSTVGLAAGAIGGLFGIGSGRKAYHRTKKLSQFQLGLNKQMFDYQNAYNTPAQQMARLKAAGLNPALMYGQGTTGNASGYPQAQINNQERFFNPADVAQSTAAGAQVSLLNKQAKLMDSQADAATAEAIYKGIKGKVDRGTLKHLKTYQMGLLGQKVEETKAYVAESNARKENYAIDTTIKKKSEASLVAQEIQKLRLLSEQADGQDFINQIKEMEARIFTGTGITRNDPSWQRIGAMVYLNILKEKPDLFEDFGEKLKESKGFRDTVSSIASFNPAFIAKILAMLQQIGILPNK